MLLFYCGNISYDVVTALTHCKSVRISFSCLYIDLSSVSDPRTREDESDFNPLSSQPSSDCIHPFYLFVSTSRVLRIFVESRQKLQQRTGCRPLWDHLFPIYWVPWQISVRPVDSACVRPSLGLAVGPCALFHSLYDVYTSVYSRLFPSSPWTIFKSPFVFFFLASFHWQAGVAFILMYVWLFFHTKCTVIKQIMFSNIFEVFSIFDLITLIRHLFLVFLWFSLLCFFCMYMLLYHLIFLFYNFVL